MCYNLCSIIGENLYFVFSHVKAKMNDDLLMGKEHTRKIIPDCHTPSPQRMLTLASEVSLEEKIGIIIDDPKFGMFGLFFSSSLVDSNNTDSIFLSSIVNGVIPVATIPTLFILFLK